MTSPHVTPAFAGRARAAVSPGHSGFHGTVDFVEAGAGDGRFLQDFARALAEEDPDFSRRVRLTAVERSPIARERLSALGVASRVLESAEELAPGSVSGWIFSNELYDALPVARVCGAADGLQ